MRPAAWVVTYGRKAEPVRTDGITSAEKALRRMTEDALRGVITDRKGRVSRAEYVIGRADRLMEQLAAERSRAAERQTGTDWER